ncbi:hypothetical protein C8A03DRAFT_17026 [Achaetomium macrosporum]|uniref:Extracellular membrane protein CFEM domain-containing protein n=1 Tax=Achaetomium macrosporum TaxID=79813 RepID=A0AAN7H9D4_9PEZI|nr:hypothetical protein C8A03DRAFT_17026 [Achaetomium macrosporum]
MKASALIPIVASVGVVHAQWWAGAPDCAHGCFSSWWSSATAWPAPTSYCEATQGASVSSCISSACQATPTAAVSYSSLSSSLCSQWSSCSSAGSTGVYTVTAPAFTGYWHGPGRNGNGNGPGGYHDWDGNWGDDRTDDRSEWEQWTRTWSGGVYTVTGCEWDGSPWAGGPGGCGFGGAAGSPWGPWGSGWKWNTITQTITQVVTVTSEGGVTALSTSVGLAAVAQAVSGDVTSTSVIGAVETTGAGGGGSSGGGAAAGRSEMLGVKVMGAVLGGVVAVAALL